MIMGSVRAGFEYFQREAGHTRTGSHDRRAGGRESGQGREADPRGGALAAAHIEGRRHAAARQLPDRARRPDRVRREVAGADSLGYSEHVGAVAAITAQHLEEALTARFGLEWVARDDGNGFEIRGISGEMMRVFSSRRESITADLRAPHRGVRAAPRARAVAGRSCAACAGVELRHAQAQGRRARRRSW
jgi:hypothetical protein